MSEVEIESTRVGRRAAADSPENALDQMTATLRNTQTELAEERTRREAAERRAAGAQTDILAAREARLSSYIAAASTTRDAATQAYRVARETGDIDGEIAAQSKLTEAVTVLTGLGHEKAALDAEKASGAASPRQQPTSSAEGPTEAEEQWIASHPRYTSDRGYQRAAQGVAQAALNEGVIRNSPAYFRYINEGLAEIFGETHGAEASTRQAGGEPQRGQTVVTSGGELADFEPAPQRQQNRQSQSAPPSRGNDMPNSQRFRVNATPAELAEWAKTNGFVDKKTGEPDTKAYLAVLAECEEDRRSGIAVDYKIGDGSLSLS